MKFHPINLIFILAYSGYAQIGEIDLFTTLAPEYLEGHSSTTQIDIADDGIAIFGNALYDTTNDELLIGDINDEYPRIDDYSPARKQALVYMTNQSDLGLYDLESKSIIQTFDLDDPNREIRIGGQPRFYFDPSDDTATTGFGFELFQLDLQSGITQNITESSSSDTEYFLFPDNGKYLVISYRGTGFFQEDVEFVELRSVETNEVLARVEIDIELGQYIRHISGLANGTDTSGVASYPLQNGILYDAASDTLAVLPAINGSYLSTGFATNGKQYGIFYNDELLIIDSISHEVVARFPSLMEANAFPGHPTDFVLTRSGDSLFVADDAGFVREWNVETGAFVKTVGDPIEATPDLQITLSNDRRLLTRYSENSGTTIIHLESLVSQTLSGSEASTREAIFSRNGDIIALIDRGYRVKAYDTVSGNLLSSYPKTRGTVSFIAHIDSPDNAIAIFETGESSLIDSRTGSYESELPKLPEHDEIHDVARQTGSAVVELISGEIQVIDTFTGDMLWSSEAYKTDYAIEAELSDSGRYLLLFNHGFNNHLARVVDLESGLDLFLLEGPEISDLTHATLSKNGQWLAVSRNRLADIYNLETKSKVTAQTNSRPASAFSENGDTYYAIDDLGGDIELQSFSSATGSVLQEIRFISPSWFRLQASDLNSVELFPDGRLGILSRDTLVVLDTLNGKATVTLPELIPQNLNSNGTVSVSEDGAAIFSVNRRGLAQSWQLIQGSYSHCRVEPSASSISLQFESRSNAFYQLQSSTDFQQWAIEGDLMVGDDLPQFFSADFPEYGRQFWRIIEFERAE